MVRAIINSSQLWFRNLVLFFFPFCWFDADVFGKAAIDGPSHGQVR
jgi:hypothetical protein